MYFGFIVSCIIEYASYCIILGNNPPTANLLCVGFRDAKTHVVAQIQHNPLGLLCRLAFAVACVTGGVWLYARPLLRRWGRQQGGVGGSKDLVTTVVTGAASLAGGLGARADEESHCVRAVSSGKTNCCSCGLPKSPKSKVLRVYAGGLFLAILVCYSNSLGW